VLDHLLGTGQGSSDARNTKFRDFIPSFGKNRERKLESRNSRKKGSNDRRSGKNRFK